jgi:hypothetical protein
MVTSIRPRARLEQVAGLSLSILAGTLSSKVALSRTRTYLTCPRHASILATTLNLQLN